MSHSQHPSPTSAHAAPGPLARRLGHLGLIPFISGALFIWLLGSRLDREPFMFVVHGLTAYAALIVALLGGLHWGMVMHQSVAHPAESQALKNALWAGTAYVVAALIAILMPPHAGLALIGFVLMACYAIDRKFYPDVGNAGWLTLRFRLTVIASLCCFLSAAQI